jgi:hypothetical protein
VHLSVWLTVLEVAGLGVLVAGVALVSVPLALICAGGLIVLACEVAERRRAVQAELSLRAAAPARPGRGEAL